MADEPKKEEIVPGAPSKDDSYNYKRDSVKTLRQIGKESTDRVKKQRIKDLEEADKAEATPEVKETPKEEPIVVKEEKPVETKPEPKVEEPKVDPKEIAREAAKIVAEETKESFKAEISKILDKNKTDIEKQNEADKLIATWEKEGRLPKDHQELISETLRIAEEKMDQRLKAERLAYQTEQTRNEQIKTEEASRIKTENETKLADFSKQIAIDLDHIYDTKDLPRPSVFEEINNPNTTDEAAKKTQEILKFGVDLNTKLAGEGKTPITSVWKIYHEHYKPYIEASGKKEASQPAGANAPVAGANNSTSAESGKEWSKTVGQLRGETWAQTKMRLARELAARARNS